MTEVAKIQSTRIGVGTGGGSLFLKGASVLFVPPTFRPFQMSHFNQARKQ